MSLFCKQCNNRRLPIWMKVENTTLWICKTCGNFTNEKDVIIRKVEQCFPEGIKQVVQSP